MVAGRAGVLQNGLVGGGEPEELENSAVEAGVGGSEVVQRGVGFGEGSEAGEMEDGVRGVADGYEGRRDEVQRGQKVMVWWRGSGGGAKGAHVDDGPLKDTV